MPWTRYLLATVGLSLLAGCSDGAGSLDATGSTTCYAGNEAYLQTKINGIMAKDSAFRGHAYLESVVGSWVARTHLLAVQDSLSKALSGTSSVAADSAKWSSEDILLGLGYISSIGGGSAAQDSLSSNGTLAFYWSGTNHLWVVTDQACSSDLNRTVSHELEHALQDQTFGLSASGSDTMSDDQYEAYKMVVEGDADYVSYMLYHDSYADCGLSCTVDFIKSYKPYAGIDYVATIPTLIQYDWGPEFIGQMRDLTQGWDTVDAYFRHYPATTTQVLHPELRHQGFADWDRTIAFSSMGSWTSMGTDRLGEVYLATLLYTWGYPSSSASPAQGWYGDRFWTWRGDDTHHAAAGRVAFTTPDSAKSFLTAWRSCFPKHYTSGTATSQDSTFTYTTTDSSFSGKALLRGDTVLVAWGNLGGNSFNSLWSDFTSHRASTVSARQLGTIKHFRLPPVHLPPPHHPYDIGLH